MVLGDQGTRPPGRAGGLRPQLMTGMFCKEEKRAHRYRLEMPGASQETHALPPRALKQGGAGAGSSHHGGQWGTPGLAGDIQ